jgi:hypothetical protein
MRTRYVKASLSSAALTALHNARSAAWKRNDDRILNRAIDWNATAKAGRAVFKKTK